MVSTNSGGLYPELMHEYLEDLRCKIDALRRVRKGLDDAIRYSTRLAEYFEPEYVDDSDSLFLGSARKEARAALLNAQDTVTAYIVDNTAPPCMDLCTLMQNKLPKRLRDMVYDYLIPDRLIVIDASHLRHRDAIETPDADRLFPRKFAQAYRAECGGHLDYLHLFDSRFADTATRADFGEYWYRTHTFAFLDTQDVPTFLECDRWCCGAEPCNTVMKIILNLRKYAEIADLSSYPEYVSKLQKGVKIDILLCNLFKQNATEREIEERVRELSAQFEALRELMRKGHTVVISDPIYNRRVTVAIEELKMELWGTKIRHAPRIPIC